jgi:hypothetical protein
MDIAMRKSKLPFIAFLAQVILFACSPYHYRVAVPAEDTSLHGKTIDSAKSPPEDKAVKVPEKMAAMAKPLWVTKGSHVATEEGKLVFYGVGTSRQTTDSDDDMQASLETADNNSRTEVTRLIEAEIKKGNNGLRGNLEDLLLNLTIIERFSDLAAGVTYALARTAL